MNIGIVGAGIVGRLLALFLIEHNHTVTLFDKTYADDLTTSSHVAAGLLSPYGELEHGNADLLSLAHDAIARWKSILSRLHLKPELNDRGSLLITPKQGVSELEHFIQRAKRCGTLFSLIPNKAIGDFEPALSGKCLTAIHLPHEGCFDAIEVMQSLKHQLLRQHVIWHENTHIDKISNRVVYTGTCHQSFDRVFDCRGLGSMNDLNDLRAVRGETILLHAPDINISRPLRLLHPRYPLYIVPRNNNHYVIGATSIESEDYSPISVHSTLELLSACYSIHSGFSEARIIKTSTQCRPAFSHHFPQIIKSSDCIHINGMYRHGFLLSPRIVSDAVTYL